MNIEKQIADAKLELLKTVEPRVRRSRRFEVHLRDPMLTSFLDEDPALFREVFDSSLSVLLRQLQKCRVILPYERDDRIDLDPSEFCTVQARYFAYQHERKQLGESSAAAVASAEAVWRDAGAHPETWLTEYFSESNGDTWIKCRPRVFDDWLFWWWVFCGGSLIHVLGLLPYDSVDWKSQFSRTYDPGVVGGGEGLKEWVVLRDYAKKVTARSNQVGLYVRMMGFDGLRASFVASSRVAAQLFEEAVKSTIPSKRAYYLPDSVLEELSR